MAASRDSRSRLCGHVPHALATDIRRTLTGSPKRLISLFVITALGATMLVGLRAACDDLLASADSFFDAQDLYDVSVQSTLGLTDADIEALGSVEGVSAAEGGYTEQAYTEVSGAAERVDIKALSAQGMNRPRVLCGELPNTPDEIAVTQKYADAAGVGIGDVATFDSGARDARPSDSSDRSSAPVSSGEKTGEVFERRAYRITAVVLDPADVNAGGETMAFRAAEGARYTFFMSRAAVRDPNVYTVAYLSVLGARDVPCYSDAYDSLIDRVKRRAEDIRPQREQARSEELRALMPAQLDGSTPDGVHGAAWYIQDRTALAGYASVDADAGSIRAIATVFPVIFFVVAVLISLTSVTRLVEEQRGLIGLYKALGYGRWAIVSKYMIYALSASLVGGVIGDLIGFVALPEIMFTIFSSMYALPGYDLGFNALDAVLGIALFAAGTTGAALIVCDHELRENPSQLMRPRAPRAGRRVMLERVAPLWRRLSFLNKVAVRNLVRYKRRFFMTVLGIAACMALMVCGLGIRDTVASLKSRQYGPSAISRYDLMAISADADYDRARELLGSSKGVRDMIGARIDSLSVSARDASESAQLVVVPDGEDLASYIRLSDMDGCAQNLPDDGIGVLITKNAQQVLGFHIGDKVELRDTALRRAEVRVDGITLNYLGNYVFMSEGTYKRAFGFDCAPNAFLAHLIGPSSAQIALARDLGRNSAFRSVMSTAEATTDFSESFKIIDLVVVVVGTMAGALAFAVVFTLTNTNISERERELATIKVLGFRRGEVRRYINKETIIMTLAGIALGCPFGFAITRLLTVALKMPSLYFDTVVAPQSYLIAGAVSLAFSLIVSAMAMRSLDRVDMVGALKSAE
ncbi:protein of unknown function DUF214 [Coriobacterium glomerans PW2]|uniref:ABC3 transporter permease C-terminal domain-containing protein n=1 Tax=Coriobacterium glomerans (strain ATCC 49209 / DSM 20642 / JCM 10262 / PW2) TaxID=700015 RepID=F2NAH8_CORGP|nr:ABC transporter permease [Coriobacterium glomerans]AEB06505.1 protein of unknown function DUF214 [Coriobacterium glomerans PW2]